MAEHTPSPWHVVIGNPGLYGAAVAHLENSPERFVGVYGAADAKAEESIPNAHLIAAAPDLLEALDACETALAPVMASHRCAEFDSLDKRCNECIGCLNAAVWQMAVTAIAKARGQS